MNDFKILFSSANLVKNLNSNHLAKKKSTSIARTPNEIGINAKNKNQKSLKKIGHLFMPGQVRCYSKFI